MQISSRFTVAVHTLLAIDTFEKEYKTTSEFLASSVNVNPVVIRRTLRDGFYRGKGGQRRRIICAQSQRDYALRYLPRGRLWQRGAVSLSRKP